MHLYNMEPRPLRGDDVTVRLGLRQLDGLLLLQHQEAVKLGRSLFVVVVFAQLKQADGLGSSFSHHALPKHRRQWGNLFWTFFSWTYMVQIQTWRPWSICWVLLFHRRSSWSWSPCPSSPCLLKQWTIISNIWKLVSTMGLHFSFLFLRIVTFSLPILTFLSILIIEIFFFQF